MPPKRKVHFEDEDPITSWDDNDGKAPTIQVTVNSKRPNPLKRKAFTVVTKQQREQKLPLKNVVVDSEAERLQTALESFTGSAAETMSQINSTIEQLGSITSQFEEKGDSVLQRMKNILSKGRLPLVVTQNPDDIVPDQEWRSGESITDIGDLIINILDWFYQTTFTIPECTHPGGTLTLAFQPFTEDGEKGVLHHIQILTTPGWEGVLSRIFTFLNKKEKLKLL